MSTLNVIKKLYYIHTNQRGIIQRYFHKLCQFTWLIVSWGIPVKCRYPILSIDKITSSITVCRLFLFATAATCPALINLAADITINCSDGNKVGSNCTFSCAGPDSTLIGSTHRVCGEYGRWSNSNPVCRSKNQLIYLFLLPIEMFPRPREIELSTEKCTLMCWFLNIGFSLEPGQFLLSLLRAKVKDNNNRQ